MNWAEEVALQIVNERPNEDIYTIASGISPSGFIHIGNFREIATPWLIVKALRKLGKKVRYILSFDDFDRYRKVPGGIDSSFSKYIGMPYSAIPSPFNEGETYARYFEKRLEDELRAMDVEVEYIYQTDEYQSGRYGEYIKLAMDNRGKIFDIIDEFRTQDAELDEKNNYYPISVFCEECGKDFTKIVSYDSESGNVDYECNCKFTGHVNIMTAKNIKLLWKVDWPMRWMAENVTFEQAGVDHNASNSSRPVSERIAREIYGFEPPIYITYNFIGIKGGGAKMSSSKGNVLTLTDLLKVYDKYLIWWFYIKYKPMSAFDIALDNDVIRYYSEFDRWTKMYFENTIDESNRKLIEFTGVTEEYLKNPNFSYIATFIPVVNNDIGLLKSLLTKENIDCDTVYFENRLNAARHWVDTYGKDYQVVILPEKNQKYFDTLSDIEKSWLNKTVFLLQEDFETAEELQTKLYSIVKDSVSETDDLKKTQKRFFQILYNLMLGKDQGPKLGLFLLAIEKDKIISLLK